jgi:threonine synthase
MKETGGWGEAPSDDEVVEGIQLLAQTTGIFGETAGGVVVGAAKRLIASGHIGRNDSLVLCNTGNGLKTKEAVQSTMNLDDPISADINEFETLLGL